MASEGKEAQKAGRPKRRICERCDRPATTCLCDAVPLQPIALSGHIIVIRHPNEKKKPMATIPVLAKCLEGMTIVHSRKLHGDANTRVDDILAWTASGCCPLYLLFPGPDAVPLDTVPLVLERGKHRQEEAGTTRREAAAAPGQSPAINWGQATSGVEAAGGVSGTDGTGTGQPLTPPGGRQRPAYVLIAVDGTWREAREMWKSNSPLLLPPLGCGVQVALPNLDAGKAKQPGVCSPSGDSTAHASSACRVDDHQGTAGAGAGAGDAEELAPSTSTRDPRHADTAGPGSSDAEYDLSGPPSGPCLIRKEPVDGYLTTYEALSQAVAILEGDQAMLHTLMAPLRMMTRYQARHDPAVAARNAWAAAAGGRGCE